MDSRKEETDMGEILAAIKKLNKNMIKGFAEQKEEMEMLRHQMQELKDEAAKRESEWKGEKLQMQNRFAALEDEMDYREKKRSKTTS